MPNPPATPTTLTYADYTALFQLFFTMDKGRSPGSRGKAAAGTRGSPPGGHSPTIPRYPYAQEGIQIIFLSLGYNPYEALRLFHLALAFGVIRQVFGSRWKTKGVYKPYKGPRYIRQAWSFHLAEIMEQTAQIEEAQRAAQIEAQAQTQAQAQGKAQTKCP
jgi:hypothetical protein